MKFKCPECGDDRIEEVLLGVVQYTEVQNVTDEDGNPSIKYGEHSLDAGEVSHFQCLHCGEHIADDEEDLLAYLKENDML